MVVIEYIYIIIKTVVFSMGSQALTDFLNFHPLDFGFENPSDRSNTLFELTKVSGLTLPWPLPLILLLVETEFPFSSTKVPTLFFLTPENKIYIQKKIKRNYFD